MRYWYFATRVAVLILVSILASCVLPIKEESRDQNSKYDGYWGLSFLRTPSETLAGQYRVKCWNMEGAGNAQIADGRVVARIRGFDLSGFINSKGKFTTQIELSGQWNFKFYGQLDSDSGIGTGRLIHNSKEQGLTGCNSKVIVKRTNF